MPVYRGMEGTIRLVLVRRNEGGIHGGQLAFPGGKHEAGDDSMLDTALREMEEETGLSPGQVNILTPLPAVKTLTTGFLIYPFLARIIPPHAWHPDKREVAEIMDVRLDDLVQPDARGEEIRQSRSWPEPRLVPFYRIGDYKLWGITYRILNPLIPGLRAGQWII